MKYALGFVFSLGLLGCGEDTVVPSARACVRANPGDDAELAQALQSTSAVSDCLGDHGHDCELEGLIAPSSAECVARDAGLEDGIRDVRTNLGYSAEAGRLSWMVQNTTESDERDGEAGALIFVDAKTGAVLGHGGWKAVP